MGVVIRYITNFDWQINWDQMKRYLAAFFAVAIVSGCATTSMGPSSREDWDSTHVRTYENVTPRQVQDAAEQILKLADKDFTFEYPDSGLIATRKWMFYVVISASSGTDYWTVETKPEGAATRVVVRVTRAASTIMASPVIGGQGVASMASGTPGFPLEQRALYKLFWDRMDYFLGKNPVWTTCDSFKERIKVEFPRGWDRGAMDTLCAINTDDRLPEGVRPASI